MRVSEQKVHDGGMRYTYLQSQSQAYAERAFGGDETMVVHYCLSESADKKFLAVFFLKVHWQMSRIMC